MVIGAAQAGEIVADKLHRDSSGMFTAEGHVRMQMDAMQIQAERLQFDVDAKSGEMYDATVHFDSGQTLKGAYLQRLDLTRFIGDNILYSACPEDDMAWQLHAKHATLDQESGTFVAQDAWFTLAGVPVMYAPRWQHALSRRSGFLMPTLAQGSRRGLEITMPFYWAASPSWDMTLSPRWMDLRGWMGELEWRHRSALGEESLQLQSVFDKQTQAQRSRVQSDMGWKLSPQWQANVAVNWVSDGLFVSDFPQLDELESLAYLTSNAAITWADDGQRATLSSQYQQRLGQVSNASTLQILPRLQTSNHINFNDGKSLDILQQTTLFQRQTGVTGWRFGVKPVWQQPWSWLGGAVNVEWTVSGQYVGYASKNKAAAVSNPANPTANATDYAGLASSVQIDMAMERVFAHQSWRHELKPVLRLDVSTAPNQKNIPLYDSALTPLSMGNLMYGNRFSGWDRFERMQRLSMLLQTSLQHKQGQAAARTVLQAQVGLAVDGLRQSVDVNLIAHATRSRSNVLAEVAWLPTAAWRLAVGGQHDPERVEWVESHASVDWSAANMGYFRSTWQRTKASYALEAESLYVSGKVHMNRRWSSQVSSQYDVLRAQVLQTSAGVAYVHPCWDMSLEAFQSYQIGSDRLSDIGVRFLLAFDGLGSIGD